MRFERPSKKIDRFITKQRRKAEGWHWWFAWYPVLNDKCTTYIWLEWVQIRYVRWPYEYWSIKED